VFFLKNIRRFTKSINPEITNYISFTHLTSFKFSGNFKIKPDPEANPEAHVVKGLHYITSSFIAEGEYHGLTVNTSASYLKGSGFNFRPEG
jgi:hypothetical protein